VELESGLWAWTYLLRLATNTSVPVLSSGRSSSRASQQAVWFGFCAAVMCGVAVQEDCS
jgi:hypothetical protein